MDSLYDFGARALRALYDRDLHSGPILDSRSHFPNAARFTAIWQSLRDEALDLARDLSEVPRFHEIMREQASISDNDARDWRMHILQAYGMRFGKNLGRCPLMTSLLDDYPEVLSASYSFLAPGKQVPAHRGPFRGILRGYLVLSMPKRADGLPAAVLKIDHHEYRLREGQFLLWDDTFLHEVWNDSDEVRIVLLLDIKRPDMPLHLRLLSGLLVRLVHLAMRVRRIPLMV